MLDIQYIRDNAELVKQKSGQKGYKVDIDNLLNLDNDRRQLLHKVEELRQKRNEQADKLKSGNPSQEDINAGKQIKIELSEQESYLAETEATFIDQLSQVPNMPTDDVPVGASEDENVIAKTEGNPTSFDFKPKNHWQIAEAKGWIDKERAAKVTGSRFIYLKGDIVKLQFAIIQFVMDKLTDQDFINEIISENNFEISAKVFTPVLPPLMLKTSMYQAMDRLEPADDRYKIEGDDLWLQGSAEHVIGSMHADEIIAETEMPIRYIGYATSFRREAGSYGKDMEGMFRLHQFDKLEMESLTKPDDGLKEHYFLIALQEKLMQLLQVPYQVLNKCTADIGKPNAHGVDIEAWLPGQNKYRETHTADYMTDYQARRLKTRVRLSDGSIELAHTNDATALALSRTPIAIIENNQTAEGDVRIPQVLRKYLNERELI